MSPEEQIDARTIEVFEELETEIVDYIHDLLGTPYPPSSVSGESPHKRSGRLQESATALARQSGSMTFLEAAVDTPYAKILDEHLNRPIAQPIIDKYTQEVTDRLQARF